VVPASILLGVVALAAAIAALTVVHALREVGRTRAALARVRPRLDPLTRGLGDDAGDLSGRLDRSRGTTTHG
jgi:hypothetical protein